ncbi:MAG: hypothetical protein HYS62_00315 [Candidatus Aenigmarchaeota archaeon]|jgi:hypothetical protein|nr:hypothetical protein [Candidatus Aenigmarchaeota archaeon]
MKAVSLIVQFIIFFAIGLGFFLMAGNLFRFQSDLIKQDVIDAGSSLALGEISAASIRAINSCKSCENVSIKVDQRMIAGYNPVYQLSNGAILEIEPEDEVLQSSVHNLNYSVTMNTPKVLASKAIVLTYDRTKNSLVIK